MTQFDAILFDVDGTLLDTTEYIQQAYQHTIKAHGGPTVTNEEINAVVGKTLQECYEILFPGGDVALLCETHNTFQMQNLHLSVPFKHTVHVLKKLKDSGKKIAAVTSRTKESSVTILQLAKIFDLFDAFVAADDVEHHKPHPEPVLKALKAMGVAPENAIMIGDTSADVGAGKNANTKTIGVTYGFHGEKIRESEPDFVVDDILDILPILLPHALSQQRTSVEE